MKVFGPFGNKAALALATVSTLASAYGLFFVLHTLRSEYWGSRAEAAGTILLSLYVAGGAAFLAVGIAMLPRSSGKLPFVASIASSALFGALAWLAQHG